MDKPIDASLFYFLYLPTPLLLINLARTVCDKLDQGRRLAIGDKQEDQAQDFKDAGLHCKEKHADHRFFDWTRLNLAHEDGIWSVSWSSKNQLVTGSLDNTVRVW